MTLDGRNVFGVDEEVCVWTAAPAVIVVLEVATLEDPVASAAVGFVGPPKPGTLLFVDLKCAAMESENSATARRVEATFGVVSECAGVEVCVRVGVVRSRVYEAAVTYV